MKVIGYIRVSTDKQDFQQQKYSLLNYAQKKKLKINDFIEVEVSSRKSKQERKINELLALLKPGDILLISELSRLGRNMLEILSIIQELTENKINIIFTQQPELSTTGTHGKLILAIYGYFAETEREIISSRTKQGLAAAKEKGKLLGRPKGSKNKKARVLDHFRE
jgi:DNA invertase Pin-like site-specific DNA recombinase